MRKSQQIDVSDLPLNWTVKDIEARMPPSFRKQKGNYRLRFILALPTVSNDRGDREFPVLLNLDEKDRLEQQMTELVELNVISKWSIWSDCPMDASMMERIVQQLRGIALKTAPKPGLLRIL